MYGQIAAAAGTAVVKNWRPIVIVLGIAVSLYFIREILEGLEKKKQLKEYEGRVEVENPQTGKIEEISPKMVAYAIYDAFYGRTWGITEDEKEAIKQLTSVPPDMVHVIAQYYSQIKDKNRNLYEDFKRFLSDRKFKEVAPWLM